MMDQDLITFEDICGRVSLSALDILATTAADMERVPVNPANDTFELLGKTSQPAAKASPLEQPCSITSGLNQPTTRQSPPLSASSAVTNEGQTNRGPAQSTGSLYVKQPPRLPTFTGEDGEDVESFVDEAERESSP